MNDLGIFSSLLVSLLEFASKEEHYQNWAFPPGLTNNKSAGKDPITTLDTLGRLTKLKTLDPFSPLEQREKSEKLMKTRTLMILQLGWAGLLNTVLWLF